MKGLLSVVVIGRNEGARLERCLASVAAMDVAGFAVETIYVDSGSTDSSVAAASGMGAKVIALQAERPTAAMGRNAGWRMAHGAEVLFLDGDTVLAPGFVREALQELAEPVVGVVWGHRRELQPRSSVYVRVMDLDWVYAAGDSEFCGGDALFRREVLEATGGFDETLIAGEEPELCRRILALGKRIVHIDRPMTGHDLGISGFWEYWKRATRAGYAYAEVSERFAETATPFWSEEARRNLVRASLLLASVLVGSGSSIVLQRFWPAGLAVGMLAVLFLRTAWKARWKSNDAFGLLLYGVHSHLQQIPIAAGQMRYRVNRRRGKQGALVEYRRG